VGVGNKLGGGGAHSLTLPEEEETRAIVWALEEDRNTKISRKSKNYLHQVLAVAKQTGVHGSYVV